MKRMNLQLFAEGSSENSGANDVAETNTESQNNSGKTYSQEELDKIVNERSERASRSALKSFFQQKGFTEEEANNAFESYKKGKAEKAEAEKNDIKAMSLRVEEAEKKASEAIARANAQIIKANAQIQATSLGVKANKLDYVIKMADLSTITINEDGSPDESAIKAQIEQILKDIPEFKDTKESAGFKIGADGNKEESSSDDALRRAFGLSPKKK